MTDPIRTFTDDDLDRMTARAWREAWRSYREARDAMTAAKGRGASAEARALAAMLAESAAYADSHWRHLVAEQSRRRAAADAARRAADAAAEEARILRPHYALMPGGRWEDQ